MKILYLINKDYFDFRMDRNRWHSIDAISKVSDLVYSGINWPNYDASKTVAQNVKAIYGGDKPDIILTYKPLEMAGMKEVSIPKCIRYNEMYRENKVRADIIDGGMNMVICHHRNDLLQYREDYPDVQFFNISHCAEATIYKDYGLPRKWDIMFCGAVTRKAYPFRYRLLQLAKVRLRKKMNVLILPHPAPGIRRRVHWTKIQGPILDKWAKIVNQSKICLTCSSRWKYRLSKYAEIPMCRSLLAGDFPDEDPDFWPQFMLELNPQDSDDELEEKILYYVNNDEERERLATRGMQLVQDYTQEKYAERFVSCVQDFLRGYK